MEPEPEPEPELQPEPEPEGNEDSGEEYDDGIYEDNGSEDGDDGEGLDEDEASDEDELEQPEFVVNGTPMTKEQQMAHLEGKAALAEQQDAASEATMLLRRLKLYKFVRPAQAPHVRAASQSSCTTLRPSGSCSSRVHGQQRVTCEKMSMSMRMRMSMVMVMSSCQI